MLRKLF